MNNQEYTDAKTGRVLSVEEAEARPSLQDFSILLERMYLLDMNKSDLYKKARELDTDKKHRLSTLNKKELQRFIVVMLCKDFNDYIPVIFRKYMK